MTLNVQAYLQETKQLVRRLSTCGINLPEELIVAILLARLPESLDTMRRILEADPLVNVEKVSQELMREATRITGKRKAETAIESANNIQVDTKRRKKTSGQLKRAPCSICGINGHSTTVCWLNPESKSYRPEFAERMQKAASSAQSRVGRSSVIQDNHENVSP